jgi:hypothetical protein
MFCGFVCFFADAGKVGFRQGDYMKSKKLHLVLIVAIGILAGAISVAAQPSSWAVGTFIGRNPNTGNRIRLVIERGGNVTARVERNTNYGTVKKDRMTINGETARLYKTNEGFRTVNNSNGETIQYVRGNGGWNTGNNDWDDNNNSGNQGGGRVPEWAVGTFYGTNPNSGGSIRLSIEANGNVRVNMQGGYTSGTIYRETLTINGESSTVRKTSGGISTRNNRTGETINYNRNNNNNNNDWDNGQQKGKVPDWAIGTFYATNPQNGSTIELSIGSDGRATVNFGGGGYAYGTVYKETLTINGETATLSRTRNGLSTTKNSDGERINYTRR